MNQYCIDIATFCVAIAGVEDCHPHRLRHTFATKLALKMDTILARKLTRHRSESSFARYSKQALEIEAPEAVL